MLFQPLCPRQQQSLILKAFLPTWLFPFFLVGIALLPLYLVRFTYIIITFMSNMPDWFLGLCYDFCHVITCLISLCFERELVSKEAALILNVILFSIATFSPHYSQEPILILAEPVKAACWMCVCSAKERNLKERQAKRWGNVGKRGMQLIVLFLCCQCWMESRWSAASLTSFGMFALSGRSSCHHWDHWSGSCSFPSMPSVTLDGKWRTAMFCSQSSISCLVYQ